MLSIWIPQLAAFLAAMLATWGTQHGLNFGDEKVLAATFVGVFTIVKTLLGRWLNPGNVNDPVLLEDSKARASQARAARAARRVGGR
jgi:hypothetical protein